MQALQVKNVNFTFSETQSLMADETIYHINQTDFIAATKVTTTDPGIFSGDLSQYIATIYMQIAWNETDSRPITTLYNSTDCSNTEVGDNPKTKGYLCPDIPKG